MVLKGPRVGFQASGGSGLGVPDFGFVAGPSQKGFRFRFQVHGLGSITSSGSIARRFLSRTSVPSEVRPAFWGFRCGDLGFGF